MASRSSLLRREVADLFSAAGTATVVAVADGPTWAWAATGLVTFHVWRAANWTRRG
ncbi:MAG: hypothetical protein ABW167_00940 [Baekduia sp.]